MTSRKLHEDRTTMGRIGIVVQGPIQTELNGHATREVLQQLQRSPLRDSLFVVFAAWEDEAPALLEEVALYVDRLVLCQKPARPGSCHRAFQAHAVSEGVKELERCGILWALKTRSDLVLTDRFLGKLLDRAAEPDYDRVLVTNLFTRYEPFHISDMVVFSSTRNLQLWFNPAPVFYEDLFSPEVQFARVFVRGRGLSYPLTLDHYFRFLRDWIDLVDFYEEGLFWFKDGCTSLRMQNRTNFIIYDRDAGPVITKLISVGFHRRLHGRVKGFTLLATCFLVADTLKRYVITTLPGFRNHHCRYTVDNKGSEISKPLSVPPVPTAPTPTISSSTWGSSGVPANGHYPRRVEEPVPISERP